MFKNILNEFRISCIVTISFAIVLCGVYPSAVWIIAHSIFPAKANGSLVSVNNRVVGSSLLGQPFSGPGYFHPRPSAAGQGYDASNSGGSNLGPTSQRLIDIVKTRIDRYRDENYLNSDINIPADAVTASASGLDPHISIENARLQASRVANNRGLKKETVLEMINTRTEGRTMWIFGEPRVNVLLLNMDLNAIKDK